MRKRRRERERERERKRERERRSLGQPRRTKREGDKQTELLYLFANSFLPLSHFLYFQICGLLCCSPHPLFPRLFPTYSTPIYIYTMAEEKPPGWKPPPPPGPPPAHIRRRKSVDERCFNPDCDQNREKGNYCMPCFIEITGINPEVKDKEQSVEEANQLLLKMKRVHRRISEVGGLPPSQLPPSTGK